MTVTQYVGSEERLRFPLSPLAAEQPVVRWDDEPPYLQELKGPEDSSGRITTYLIVPTRLKPAEAVVELSLVDDLVAALPERHPLHDVIIDVDFR